MGRLLHAELGLSVPRGGRGAEPSSAWKTTTGKRPENDGYPCSSVIAMGWVSAMVCLLHAELGLSVPSGGLSDG
jgi:hypothetical protein